MSRGRAIGHSGSNRPRRAPSAAHRARPGPSAARDVLREDRRQRGEHDPEVLGQVADVLDGPVRVVAERPVAVRLQLVEVLVAGVEELPGRDEVVGEEQPDRDDRPESRRDGPPGERPAASDEHEERRPEDHREAGGAGDPEQEPRDELPPVDEGERGAEPGRDLRDGAPDGRPDGRAERPLGLASSSAASGMASAPNERSPPSAIPTATSSGASATTWAKNHVVPRPAAYQTTVPKPKKTVTASRTGRPTGRRPRAHQHSPTSIAPTTTETARSSVATPHSATNGMRTIAGQGREREEAEARQVAGGIPQREDVLEEVVAGDRPGDRGPSVEEGEGLPDEVVVVANGAGQPVRGQRGRDESGPDERRGEEVEPVRIAPGDPGPGATLCYPALHLIARAGGRTG